jgi:glycosyltransferase involved in cell wall biosynthesis
MDYGIEFIIFFSFLPDFQINLHNKKLSISLYKNIMNNHLLISIVVPTYNRSKYLQRCLDSILSQDGKYYEVIVSDNASPDNTQELMENYLNDSRIHYYRNTTNLGVRENVYKATGYAQGQYIFWLTDDDYLLPNALSKVVEIINSNSEIGYIYSPFSTLDDRDGKIIGKYENFSQDILLKSGIETIAQVLPATWVFSRQILKKEFIDWTVWEKYKKNSYFMTILVGRILLKSPAYYIASELIVHTWYNPIYWEEFGKTSLDIQLFNQISYKDCMQSCFFDQKQTKEIRKIIDNWENQCLKDFLQNPEVGFDYLVREKGLKEGISWILKSYKLNFKMVIILCKFFYENKLLFFIKTKIKKYLKWLSNHNYLVYFSIKIKIWREIFDKYL